MTDTRCGCNHLAEQHAPVEGDFGLEGPCAECHCPGWHAEHEIVDTFINDRWPLRLPDYRAYRASRAWHEATRLAAMYEAIKPGDVVFEVGAEEGDYGALFTSWGAKVVLVEPNPKAWPSIKASFEANGFRPLAWLVALLSDHEWRLDDDDVRNRFGHTGWPTVADGELIAEHGFFNIWEHPTVCPAWTLDQLAARVGRPPQVISIDVEGGELHVLNGARRTLTEHRPVVFVSVHPDFMRQHYNVEPADLFNLMTDLGYEATFLATDHEDHYRFTVAT